MKTSSYFLYKGPGRISISRSIPAQFKNHGIPEYKPLAPGPWFKSVAYDEYRRLYFAQLAKLNPMQVVADLNALSPDAEPILLCWEKLFDTKEFCHRHMVAEWLLSEIGLIVPELYL